MAVRPAPTPAPGAQLRALLARLDRGPFAGYRRLLGEHDLGDFRLEVIYVPPDALAGPARLRLGLRRQAAGLDGAWLGRAAARRLVEDAIASAAAKAIEDLPGPPVAAAPGSGRLTVSAPGPGLHDRTIAEVGADFISVGFSFDLPAADRRVRGEQASAVLFERLPRIGMAALLFPPRRVRELKARAAALEARESAAAGLAARGLAAWIPAAALPDRAIPDGLATSIERPEGTASGLGLPSGVTVVVGSRIAGAGPWIRSLRSGAANAVDDDALFAGAAARVRVRSGPVGPIDLSAFVKPCPEHARPEALRDDTPSALVAAAASLVEAVEGGARMLFIDEDDVPAGFLGVDGRMQRLLGDRQTPFIPLVDRLADMRDRWGLSLMIAARGQGDLCVAADTVLVLGEGGLEDASERARRMRRATEAFRTAPELAPAGLPMARELRIAGSGGASLKVGVWGVRGVRLGDDLVDLSETSIVRDAGCLRAIALLLARAADRATAFRPVDEVLDDLVAASERDALAALERPDLRDLTRPTRLEIHQALVRWNRVEFRLAPATLRAPARH